MAANRTQEAGTLSIEKFGGHLLNLILGALVLWVGQTTFKHNGQLNGMQKQLDHLSQSDQKFTTALYRRTDNRFTAEDGLQLERRLEKAINQIYVHSQSLVALKTEVAYLKPSNTRDGLIKRIAVLEEHLRELILAIGKDSRIVRRVP